MDNHNRTDDRTRAQQPELPTDTHAAGGRKWPLAMVVAVVVCVGILGLVALKRIWDGDRRSHQDASPAPDGQPLPPDDAPLGTRPAAAASAAVPPEPPTPAAQPSTGPPGPPALAGELTRPLPDTVQAAAEEALQAARRLTEDFPESAGAMAVLAAAYDDQGKTAKAVGCWQRCLEIDPELPDAYRGMARVAFRKAQYEKAVTLCQEVLKANPREPGANNFIARALICLGRTEDAVEALKRDIEISPRAPHSHYLLGQRHLQSKRYQQAKQCYQTAIRLQGDFTNAYYGLATVCARLGQKEEAQRYREEFTKLQARDLKALEDQTRDFDDLLRARQQTAKTLTDAGRYYYRGRNPRRAGQLWQRAAALDPANATCRRQLAALYEAAGREQDLLRVLEQLSRIQPHDALIFARIGNLKIRARQFDGAEAAFRKIIELAPKRPEGHAWLAQLYLRLDKRPQQAKSLAAAAVAIDPTAENYSVLGEACQRCGDRQGAMAALKRAVELEPGSDQYKRMYRQIQQNK